MKIFWTAEALSQIETIIGYIAVENAKAAIKMADRIFNSVKTHLPSNPNSGRPGRVEGTRELVIHRSYIVVYQIAGADIEILTVRHAARLWSEDF